MTEAERLALDLIEEAESRALAYGFVYPTLTEAAAELRRLQAENESLRADAERWRWWRRWFRTLTTYDVARAVGLDLTRIYVTTPEQMDKVTDAAIDAARKA